MDKKANNLSSWLELRNRYIPALLIIALFSGWTYKNQHEIMSTIEKDGEIINISGRQRMLSQKLVLLTKEYIESPTLINEQDLKKNIILMKDSHQYLLKYTLTDNLKKLYYTQNLDKNLTSFIRKLGTVHTLKDITLLTDLRKDSQALLLQLDRAVKEYENYSKEKLEKLHQNTRNIFFITILVLLLEALFIFYPASRSIKKNTKELDDQKKYLDTVIESSKNAIIAIDEELKIRTYNKSAQEIFGYTIDEMIGNNILYKIIPEKYLSAHNKAVKSYMDTGISKGVIDGTHELEGKRKNGEIFPIKISFGVQIIGGKRIVVANIIDMTLEVKYRDGLNKLNDELEHKVDEKTKELQKYLDIINQHILISTTDTKGVITYANEAFCKTCGYTKEELEGKPHNIVRHPDMPKSAFKDMWDTIKSGKVWRGEVKNLKKDGNYYWVDAVVSPNFDKDGNIDSYNAVRIDITDNIKLEELTHYQETIINAQIKVANAERDKAQEYAKAKGEFLANMSHEIRTPLNAILGFVDILKEEDKGRKSIEYVNIIYKSSQSLLKIIEDILDFSKIESGKLNIDNIYFDPVDEFKIITDLFGGKCSQNNISFNLSIDGSLPNSIKSDPLRIKQVISNLMSNAIKFTEEGKRIFVDISFEKDLLKISVKDEGKGIAQEKLEHIFEAFNQEDNSTTRDYGGTGLGLAISNELVNLLGGTLNVKSELGKGSEFYFLIPVKSSNEIKNKNILNKNYTFNNEKILVVEDNKSNQMLMKIVLKKMNLSFEFANDGIEAIEIYKKDNSFEIILMDENMPNMNGIEATKHILKFEEKNNLKHTPIIALTANALKGDREKFLDAGMDEYLTKPIDKNKLGDVLNRFFKI